MNMHVYQIINVDWQGEEFYFTVEDHRGITGKVQLNMRSIINDYNHYIVWEEEEE
jgi:hypothetical protein